MKTKYYCHAYQFKIFYVGWVLVVKYPKDKYWYDNTLIEDVFESRYVRYLTIGLDLEKVIKRLRKWCEKNSEKEKEN